MLFAKSTFFFDTVYEKEDSQTFFGANYQSFGSTMTGRTFSSDKYRYGFNGKENDNEVKGQGAQQDYGMRIYDPRLGRFLSVDPLFKDFPELTTYQFASNTPIQAIDLDGLESQQETYGNDKIIPVITIPASSTLQVPIIPGSLDYLSKGSIPESDPITEALIAGAEIIMEEFVEPILIALKGQDLEGEKVTGAQRAVAIINFITTGKTGKSGGKKLNKVEPNKSAAGDHSSFKTDKNGKMTRYETYKKQDNPQDPKPFKKEKAVDVDPNSKPHYDKKTKKFVDAPHTTDSKGNTKPSSPDELPKK
jgi:RHS repeat-associated protein